jgi:hypothetical protein
VLKLLVGICGYQTFRALITYAVKQFLNDIKEHSVEYWLRKFYVPEVSWAEYVLLLAGTAYTVVL